MRLEVKQWGNSKAVRLPKDFIVGQGLHTGDFLEIFAVDEHKFLLEVRKQQIEKPERKRLTLQERLAISKDELPVLEDWDSMQPVGEEIW